MADPQNTPNTPAVTIRSARPRKRRWLRWLLRGLLLLTLALVLLVVAAGWWASREGSLATVIAQAGRFMPQGISLQGRDISGSLLRGGRAGWLRWQGDALAVEVHDLRLQWTPQALLRGKLQVDALQAQSILLQPLESTRVREPAAPAQPLENLTLPLDVEVPLQVGRIQWGDPPGVEITALQAAWRYSHDQHQLDITRLDMPGSHFTAQARLDGAAPMALQTSVEALIDPNADTLADDDGDKPAAITLPPVRVLAHADGTLAGAAARIQLQAHVTRTATDETATANDGDTLASLQATIAPWARQPLAQASATLHHFDPARLHAAAPVAQLSGTLDASPDEAGVWQLQAHIANALPGTWDVRHLPLKSLDATATFDGAELSVPHAAAQLLQGSLTAQGRWQTAGDWSQQPPLQVQADLEEIDPASLWSRLPKASISAHLQAGAPDTGPPWQVRASIHNALPGALDAEKLPLEQLDVEAGFSAGRWSLEQALARIGQGSVQAHGEWAASAPWDMQADIRNLQPADIHTRMRQAPLSGLIRANGQNGSEGDVHFETSIQGSAPVSATTLFPDIRVVRASGLWQAASQLLTLDALHIQASDASVDGQLQADIAALSAQGSLSLQVPGVSANIKGNMGREAGDGELHARLDDAPALQAWLEKLPALPAALLQYAPDGHVTLDGRWSAGWQSLLQASSASSRNSPASSQPLATLTLEAKDLQWTDPETRRQATLNTAAHIRLTQPGAWLAQVNTLSASALDGIHEQPWSLALDAPLSVTVRLPPPNGQRLSVTATPGALDIRAPAPGEVRIAWQALDYSRDGHSHRLKNQGSISGLPWQWHSALLELAGQDAARIPLDGDLVLDATWNVDLGDTLHLQAGVARRSGDLGFAVGNSSQQTAAGIRKAAITLQAGDGPLNLALDWDSARMGRIQASASTALEHGDGGWVWSEHAPLQGQLKAQMPDIGAWSLLAPPGWRVNGTLDADVRLDGTRAQPAWSGSLNADDLAIRSTIEGVDLHDGQLRSRLSGTTLTVDEFTLHGSTAAATRITGLGGNVNVSPDISLPGELRASGSFGWDAGAGGMALEVRIQLAALRVLARADRQLTLSGDATIDMHDGLLKVQGDLRTDRAVIVLADESAPTLDDDVIVLRDETPEAGEAASTSALMPQIHLTFDLGRDFAIQGFGLTSRMEGRLAVTSSGETSGLPQVDGVITLVDGRYRAWGQRLDVSRGLISFSGEADNPVLDILAIRPNIDVTAGVQISGTAQNPRISLYAEEDMPDSEKLSWVMFGHSTSGSGGEAAMLQQVAQALLFGGSGGGFTQSLARTMGLDEIGIGGGDSASGGVSGASLALGKRLSSRLYVTYEKSLVGTMGTLYIFYDLSRRLRLRGQAGMQNSLDLIYTIAFD